MCYSEQRTGKALSAILSNFDDVQLLRGAAWGVFKRPRASREEMRI